jgi:hypothetical protein
MSPIEVNPDEDVMPDPAVTDLAGAMRGFVKAALAGRVTQSATVHAWAAHLEPLIDEAAPASTPSRRWN